MLLTGYFKVSGWGYAADADGKTVTTELSNGTEPIFAHFSYLTLNIQKFIVTGKPTALWNGIC